MTFLRNQLSGAPFQLDLLRLTYTSLRAGDVSDDDVVELALRANRANRGLDITGCLWFGDRTFFQVLEGPRGVVDALYRRIELDPRHSQVRLLSYGAIVERQFGRWALAHVSEGEDAIVRDLVAQYAGLQYQTPPEQQESNSPLRQIIDRLVAAVIKRPEMVARAG